MKKYKPLIPFFISLLLLSTCNVSALERSEIEKGIEPTIKLCDNLDLEYRDVHYEMRAFQKEAELAKIEYETKYERLREMYPNLPDEYLGHVSGVINGEATAYTHTGNATFTGVMPKVGMIAVDQRVIPLNSYVYVPNIGLLKATDTGGVIKGNIIDIFMDTRQECIEFGRQNITIYVLTI